MLCSFSEDKIQCCKFFFFFNRKVKILLTAFHVNHQVMRQIRYRFTLVTIWGVNCYRGYNILPADLISVEKPTNPIFPSPNVGNTTPIPIHSVCHQHNTTTVTGLCARRHRAPDPVLQECLWGSKIATDAPTTLRWWSW